MRIRVLVECLVAALVGFYSHGGPPSPETSGNPLLFLLFCLTGVILGALTSSAVWLLGAAMMAVFPLWSGIDAAMRPGTHNLLGIEWVLYGFFVLPAAGMVFFGRSIQGVVRGRSKWGSLIPGGVLFVAIMLLAFSCARQRPEPPPTAKQFYRLDELAEEAYKEHRFNDAEQHAQELLRLAQDFKGDWNYGNALHHGNRILGLVALKNGDVANAKAYLLASGKTPGSPQLNSFGPNMSLAKVLLEAGEKATVLEYLRLCKNFWKDQKLPVWIAAVEAGEMPDFGANLSY